MLKGQVSTHFSKLLSVGRRDEVVNAIEQWPVIFSPDVTTCAEDDQKLFGTVVHISKAKKVSVASKSADKKAKREMAYHRLVFVR